MKLILETKYRSLEPFVSIELPDLTILTGLNGAGKTQILTATNEEFINITDNDTELKPRKYVTNQTLSPNDSKAVT